MSTSEAHVLSGAQAAQDVCAAMLEAAGAVMTLHGDDPNGTAILGAGIAMVVEKIDTRIDPGFKRKLLKLLTST